MNICFLLFSLLSFCSHTHAAIFQIRNNCDFTIWAAAVLGDGRQLNQTDVWTLEVKPDITNARIWA